LSLAYYLKEPKRKKKFVNRYEKKTNNLKITKKNVGKWGGLGKMPFRKL